MLFEWENEFYLNGHIQSNEISSSTDIFVPQDSPPSTPPSARRILEDIRRTRAEGRRSYRRIVRSNREVDFRDNARVRLFEDDEWARMEIGNFAPSAPPSADADNAVPTKTQSTRYSLAILAGIFLSSLLGLYLVYSNFPQLTPEEKIHIKIPWNINDAKNLGTVLDKYKENHYIQVYLGVSMTYIFLQTFAIPGSLFLSVLSGFLFNFFQGLILVCTCSALGATLCFLLSQLVGRKLIFKYFPEKAEQWETSVERHRKNLLNYVIFLRVTPFLPNWFINLTAPVIGVPLWPFALGTFIGVAPPSFVALQAGKTLHNMSASDSAFSWISFFMLIVFGFLSLIPIYFKDKLKKKFE